MRVEHIQATNLTGDIETDTSLCKMNWLAKLRSMRLKPVGGNHITFRLDNGNMKTVGEVEELKPGVELP